MLIMDDVLHPEAKRRHAVSDLMIITGIERIDMAVNMMVPLLLKN